MVWQKDYFDKPDIALNKLHLWADFVELYCIFDNTREAYFSDILDERWGCNDGLGGIPNVLGEEDFAYDSLGNRLPIYEERDQKEIRFVDLKSHLTARSELFGDLYPFSIDKFGISLKKEINELYIFLLCASNLKFFERPNQSKFSSDFEGLSAIALRKAFPSTFEVRIVGTNQCNEVEKISGSPKIKLEKIAELLETTVTIKQTALERLNTPNGDAGIDFVAWLPFLDGCSQTFLVIGQAACTSDEEEMFTKMATVNPQYWRSRLKNVTPIDLLLTPQCYRDASKGWVDDTRIHWPCFDRYRLLYLLKEDLSVRDKTWLKSYQILQEILF